MINWFDMPAEGLSNGGLFEVKELEVTENGTYETKGEMYNKVTVNVEGGGANYKAYDFVIRKIGDGTPTLEKGSYEEVYDKLQNQEPVSGLYVENTEIGEYHDTNCHYVPFDEVYYYSSADAIFARAICYYNGGMHRLELRWEEDNSLTVTVANT